MYARQSYPIGLSGLLDTIKDITAAGAMTYLQFKSDKELKAEQEAAMRQERERLEFQRQMTVQQAARGGGFDFGGIGMPVLLGIGALGLFFFMRK